MKRMMGMKKLMCCFIVLCIALTPLTVLAANEKKVNDQQKGGQSDNKAKAAQEKLEQAKRAAFDAAHKKLTKQQRDKLYDDTIAKEKAALIEKMERTAFDQDNKKLTKEQKDKLYKAKKELDKKLEELKKSETALQGDEKTLNVQKDSLLKDNTQLEGSVDEAVAADAAVLVDEEAADVSDMETLEPSLEAKANKAERIKNLKTYKDNLKKLLDKITEQEKLIAVNYKATKYAEVLALKKQIIGIRTDINKLNRSFIEQEKKMKAKLDTFKKELEKQTIEKKAKKEESVIEDVYAQ